MKRGALTVVALIILAGLCWVFPLFHIVPLERAEKEKEAATFNPTAFAENFWDARLLKSANETVDADLLLRTIQKDPAEARKKFSHSLGISDSYTYYLSGTGRVVAASGDEVSLVVTPSATNAEIALQTGLIFGNAVRDATGLLNVNDYPNSQDFNGISDALNHLVETRVLPRLKEKAKIGALVRFVGCAEVNDEDSDLRPLKVVPIQVESE